MASTLATVFRAWSRTDLCSSTPRPRQASPRSRKNSFHGQQGVADLMGFARFGQEGIKQSTVIASGWLHHVGERVLRRLPRTPPCASRRHPRRAPLGMGQDQFQKGLTGLPSIRRPTASFAARDFALQRRADQPILGRKAVDETAFADPCTLPATASEREISAAGIRGSRSRRHQRSGLGQFPFSVSKLLPLAFPTGRSYNDSNCPVQLTTTVCVRGSHRGTLPLSTNENSIP